MILITRKRILLLILILFISALFYRSGWVGKAIYPIHYKQQIQASANKFGVDPLLVAAIIRVESNYKTDLKSSKGAVGIMQIMPETAEWILNKEGFDTLSLNDLYLAQANIQIGTKYIDLLNQYFHSNLIEIIAAYNAGQGNVSKWRESGIWDGTQDSIEQIPFWETRSYVERVLYYYKKYNDIYA